MNFLSLTIDEKIFEVPEDEICVDEVLTDERRAALEQFAAKVGVNFSNIELLNVALTHKSYSREFDPPIRYNERLEFLGDAVLGLAAAEYLFEHFPHLREGELTKMRSSVVRQSTLTRLAKELGLGELMLFGPTEILYGRERETNLEDAFESIIGAIYLDCGWEVVRDYVWQRLAPEFERVRRTGIPKDYKSKLQEVIQRQGAEPKLTYSTLNVEGPPHLRSFESAAVLDGKIIGRGFGRSKKLAEQEAARDALQKLGEL